MAFKFSAQRQEEDKIRPEVRALAERGNVTLEEWREFRGNSWELELVAKHLDDEAFAYHAEYMLKNCQFERDRPWRSYNEAVMGSVGPELLRRFRKALADTAPANGHGSYQPAADLVQHEPLVAALVAMGASKDMALEEITKEYIEMKERAVKLAMMQPPAPIIVGLPRQRTDDGEGMGDGWGRQNLGRYDAKRDGEP